MSHDTSINIRVCKSDLDLIDRAATVQRCTRSDFLRRCAEQAVLTVFASPRLVEDKTERNRRVQERYDDLMREGKHGHYETLFRIVREEVEMALAASAVRP